MYISIVLLVLSAAITLCAANTVLGNDGARGASTLGIEQNGSFANTDEKYYPSSVVNGFSTDSITALYVAYVQTEYSDGKTYFCSGTVIDKMAVVTAAHCVYKSLLTTLTVRVWVGSTTPRSGTMYIPSTVYIQEGYSEDSFVNDLAVIKFSETFSSPFSVAQLPNSRKRLPVETLVYISGFGKVSNTGLSATSLQTVILRVENSYTCGSIFIPVIKDSLTPQNFFCVTDPRFPDVVERGSCYGDSGGPLYTKSAKGRMIVMGAYSFHIAGNCVQPRQTHMYTNLVTRADLIKGFLKGSTTGWSLVL